MCTGRSRRPFAHSVCECVCVWVCVWVRARACSRGPTHPNKLAWIVHAHTYVHRQSQRAACLACSRGPLTAMMRTARPPAAAWRVAAAACRILESVGQWRDWGALGEVGAHRAGGRGAWPLVCVLVFATGWPLAHTKEWRQGQGLGCRCTYRLCGAGVCQAAEHEWGLCRFMFVCCVCTRWARRDGGLGLSAASRQRLPGQGARHRAIYAAHTAHWCTCHKGM